MAAAVPEGFTDELVLGGLAQPTVAAFAPDGRLFVGEKSGLVKTYDSITDTTPTIAADLRPQVMDYWDRGLLGLAVDPGYPTRPFLYALYTYDAVPGGIHPRWNDACADPTGQGCLVTGRLSRLTLDTNGVATGAAEVKITDWCQQYPSHSIGTVTFGPDGALYVGGGDGASFTFVDYGQRSNPCGDPPEPAGTSLSAPTARGGALRSLSPLRPAAEPRTLDGAILRVDPDTGAGVPGNPFAGSADLNERRIISYGLRNPFRFDFRPGTNELWVGDVGWSAWEEINVIPDATAAVAKNFGWPCYEGSGRQAGYDGANLTMCESLYVGSGQADPYYAYHHSAPVVADDGCPTGSSSVTGIAFEKGTSNYPAGYAGALFFADSSRGCIWAMQLGVDGNPDPNKLVALSSAAVRPVQLLFGPDGNLYYVSFDSGQLRRFTYTSGNRAPVANIAAAPTSGTAPLTVQFDGSGSSDPDGGALSYAWDLDGDGAFDDATTVAPQYTYLTAGTVQAGLRVSDPEGLSDTETVTISVGAPADPNPVAMIDAPTAADLWQVDQTVAFSGRGSDPQDGELSDLTWQLTLQHCSSPDTCHAHPMGSFTGASGSFQAPDHGYPSYLDLTLTARDSDGNTASDTVRIHPRTVDLAFDTNPGALELTVGGVTDRAPFSRTAIIGSTNSISAPNPQDPGDFWFMGWNIGGNRAQEVTAPSQSDIYRASYLTCTIGGAKVADCGGPTPSAPQDVQVSGGRGKAIVSWTPPHWPGIDGVAKYQVVVDGGKTYDVDPAETSQRVGGLGNRGGTVSVRAFSSAGGGPVVSKTIR